MPEILVLGTSRHTHGGIASVLRAYERTTAWSAHGCRWIATHRSGSRLTKVAYMLSGLLIYMFFLPWAGTVHVNIGELPSARRKTLFVGLARLLRKRVIVHAHVYDVAATGGEVNRRVYGRLFRAADHVVALSEISQRTLRREFGLGDKVTVLYNPCPALPDYGNDSEAKRDMILCAGVITEAKGYRELLKAFARIAPRHPGWTLTLAGSGDIERARALAAELGIGDRVEFPGWVSGPEKDRLFRRARILCHPSHAEGFPMAVLEAWAYGLPVAATPVGGLPDKVTHGSDIMLSPVGDVDALAANLDALIGDSALRGRIAEGSRRFALRDFNINAIGRQLSELYD